MVPHHYENYLGRDLHVTIWSYSSQDWFDIVTPSSSGPSLMSMAPVAIQKEYERIQSLCGIQEPIGTLAHKSSITGHISYLHRRCVRSEIPHRGHGGHCLAGSWHDPRGEGCGSQNHNSGGHGRILWIQNADGNPSYRAGYLQSSHMSKDLFPSWLQWRQSSPSPRVSSLWRRRTCYHQWLPACPLRGSC